MSHFLPIAALLAGSALLLMAGGLHGLLLPLRGSIEGFSDASLGLLGTGWAIGYIAGCLLIPPIVSRVGHIRTFGVLCSLAGIVVLLNLVLMHPLFWVPLRALSGFCFAGGAMVVESWLSERASPESRGRIFGIYTMINLAATTIGQMLLTLGDPAGYLFFVVGSIIYSLALLPTALSTAAQPVPLARVRLDVRALWHQSPVAVIGVLLIGISNSAFGTLGAVYGRQIGLSVTDIATMMSVALLAGALIQVPVGFLSDRLDRRVVLIGLALAGSAIGIALGFGAGLEPLLVIALIGAFGGMIYSMYPVIVAHANDHAPRWRVPQDKWRFAAAVRRRVRDWPAAGRRNDDTDHARGSVPGDDACPCQHHRLCPLAHFQTQGHACRRQGRLRGHVLGRAFLHARDADHGSARRGGRNRGGARGGAGRGRRRIRRGRPG